MDEIMQGLPGIKDNVIEVIQMEMWGVFNRLQ